MDWVIQPPALIRWLFPRSLWRDGSGRKVIYLTFDDGPVPEQTPWVLDLLRKHGIRATFFCVGDNVRKHPDLFRRLVEEGHSVGNHTFNHVPLFRKGVTWRSYLDNVSLCDEAMSPHRPALFRAPHGHITPLRAWQLTRERFKRIVFWDVMPKDYDSRLEPQQVLDNVIRHVRPGSVIVFHDSIKAGPRMRHALEGTILHFKELGYEFLPIRF